MASARIFVYGASGHGKVVLDVARSAGLDVVGFVDDGPGPHPPRMGLPVMGDGRWLQAEAAKGGVAVLLGIGDNATREQVSERCRSWGADVLGSVHPRATVAESARLGHGTVVMAGAVVNPDATVGEGCIINTGAVVEHDVILGDYAHVSPNATLAGGVSLGARSQLGAGATVIPAVRIGSNTLVGAGAVVVRDLPDDVIAMGVPARVVRHRSGTR